MQEFAETQGGQGSCRRQTPGLTGDVLVACASQHGVHGVAHLVEEVLHHARCEQRGRALGGGGQAQHQHHHRQLVLARRLATPPATDGEVAVLRQWSGWLIGGTARILSFSLLVAKNQLRISIGLVDLNIIILN